MSVNAPSKKKRENLAVNTQFCEECSSPELLLQSQKIRGLTYAPAFYAGSVVVYIHK